MVIILSGWLALLLLALMVLGMPQTHQAFLATYEQTYHYLLEPDFARASIRWVNQALADQQWLSAIALLTVKITALNFIPVPFLTGGAAIQETAAAILGRPVQFPNQWMATTFLMAIGLFCLFLVRTWNAL
jgi:membrane-associated protease RseP (regulator of RpoE activity)